MKAVSLVLLSSTASSLKFFLIWLSVCLIWGTTWIAIKIGLADLPPLPFVGIRFAIAGLVLLAVCAVRRRPVLPPHDPGVWRFLILSGILNFTGNYGLIFWSEQYIPAGLTALISSLTPGFTFLFAHFFLANERLSWTKMAGLLLGVAGVALIFIDQLHAAGIMALIGSCTMLASTWFASSFSVWSKASGGAFDPALMAGWQMLFGCLPTLLVGVALSGNPLHYHWTLSAIEMLLYLALIGSSLAFFLFFYLLRHVDVGKVITTNLVTPIISVTFGWLLLGEVLNKTALIGGAIILCGTALIVKPKLEIFKSSKAATAKP